MVVPAGKIQVPFEVLASMELEVRKIAAQAPAESGVGQKPRRSLRSARQKLAEPVERTQEHRQIQLVPSRLLRPILQMSRVLLPVVLPVKLPVVAPVLSEAGPPVAVHVNRTKKKDQQ